MITQVVEKTKEMKNHMSKLTNVLVVMERGKFRTQAQPKPNGQHMAQISGSGENNLKEVIAITTRSRKVIEPTPKPRENEKDPYSAEDGIPSEEVVKNPSKVPFPQALKSTAKPTRQHSEILEHLKQERILPKYKDPGCPTVSCTIGNHEFAQALLDLGTSVNITPYDLGVVEDVLVQIYKFYYPVDFFILDVKVDVNVNSKILTILGRSFLATAKALINCRNGLMKLSFGNMTLDVNIFHIMKQSEDDDEFHQTYMIDALIEEEVHALIDFDPLNSFLLNSKIPTGYDNGEYADICAAFDYFQDYGT
ncbi:uncharacterized protein LOC111378559 [Olea europaea var. sylvestris]|uniref:uncharacterized protein LOC111378559 n=1 Tax=Olea europaea var. sylvestris TaxID=158386 RepID=UPI000C1D015F|nr:uncharacterized protein LOC111378559 [Olea europaea var. sylvestris]